MTVQGIFWGHPLVLTVEHAAVVLQQPVDRLVEIYDEMMLSIRAGFVASPEHRDSRGRAHGSEAVVAAGRIGRGRMERRHEGEVAVPIRPGTSAVASARGFPG